MLIGKPCLDPFIYILQFSFDIQLNQTLCADCMQAQKPVLILCSHKGEEEYQVDVYIRR